MKTISHSQEQTIKIAKKISHHLKGAETIALSGNLGAGKTVFIKGLAKSLGLEENITSPTFVLMKTYKLPNKKKNIEYFIHVDAYRLKGANELINIGIKDWFNKKNTVVAIEWANKIKNILPKNTKFVNIKHKFNKANTR